MRGREVAHPGRQLPSSRGRPVDSARPRPPAAWEEDCHPVKRLDYTLPEDAVAGDGAVAPGGHVPGCNQLISYTARPAVTCERRTGVPSLPRATSRLPQDCPQHVVHFLPMSRGKGRGH